MLEIMFSAIPALGLGEYPQILQLDLGSPANLVLGLWESPNIVLGPGESPKSAMTRGIPQFL